MNESMYFTGLFLSHIAYGAAVTLGLQCLALLRSTTVGSLQARRLWTAIVLFILITETACVATGHTFEKSAFITYRDFPGGPSTWISIVIRVKIIVLMEPSTTVGYIAAFFSLPKNSISFVFFITSSLACDAILVRNGDDTSISIPLTIFKGVQIHYPVQRLLDTDNQMLCVPHSVHYVSCRYRRADYLLWEIETL
jgi:hypothetical protein